MFANIAPFTEEISIEIFKKESMYEVTKSNR